MEQAQAGARGLSALDNVCWADGVPAHVRATVCLLLRRGRLRDPRAPADTSSESPDNMIYSRLAGQPTRNRLLAALPPEICLKLLEQMDRVDLPLRQVVMAPDEEITAVYFPETGWISMIARMADGNSAEVGIVGLEGMVGLPILMGVETSSVEGLVQGSGAMLRMSAQAFRQALDETPELRKSLLRYAVAFQDQVTQTAACNGNHALDQRMARWLLMAHDRAEDDDFPMTHEFLATMLCVHRPGITTTARLFQQVGFIKYGQGRLRVTDRAGLEAAACECYETVRRRFDVLLGTPVA